MISFGRFRSFMLKLFTTLLVVCICHLIFFELIGDSEELFSSENEEIRFKRSVEEGKEVLLDLPGHMNNDQFIRSKRINKTSSRKRFVATNDWQTIEEDHIVPSGLHYRIDLSTGKKQAKLLNNKNYVNKSKELLAIKNESNDDDQLNQKISQPDKNQIDNFKNEFHKFKFDEKNSELDQKSDLKNWKSIDQIKKEFEELNIKMTTDSENVNSLLDRYKKTNDDNEKITILKDLEYILHQYDVSGDFIKMDGLNVLKNDFLNNPNNEIQSLISLVIGSASSGNPPVKVAIIGSGLFENLIRKLDNDKDLKLNLKTIYAISSIIRQFPFGQKQFIEQDGLKIFKKFFDNSNDSKSIVKIQTKIISLLSDLKEEHQFTADELESLKGMNSSTKSSLEEKLKQYNQVNLDQNFMKEGYCLVLPKNLNNTNYDIQEKVLKSMNSFRSVCKDDFKKHMSDLIKIKQNLDQKIEKDKLNHDGDDYYQNLVQLTQNLIDYLNI